jgi:hypothetical protein
MVDITRTMGNCSYMHFAANVICLVSGAASSCVLGFSGEGDGVGVQPASY